MRLRVVMPVPDHRVAAASRATHALWPAVLAHQGEALRVVEQGCEVDRVHCGHDDRTPRVHRPPLTAWNRHHTRTRRYEPPSPRKPIRAGAKTGAVDRAVDDAGCRDAVAAQRRQKGQGAAARLRHLGNQAGATGAHRPCRRVMLVLAQVSSMKTSRLASSRP